MGQQLKMTRRSMICFFASSWIFFGCQKDLTSKQIGELICNRAKTVAAQARGLRLVCLADLKEAMRHVELAHALKDKKELTAEQKILSSVGGGSWRHAWQYAFAAGASCEASERVSSLVGVIIHDIVELRLFVYESALHDALNGALRSFSGSLFNEGVFGKYDLVREFPANYRKTKYEPVRKWATAQRKREKKLIEHCVESVKSL